MLGNEIREKSERETTQKLSMENVILPVERFKLGTAVAVTLCSNKLSSRDDYANLLSPIQGSRVQT